MGRELKTIARYKQRESIGKLHVDAKMISFAGKEFKWHAELGGNLKAVGRDGWLVVESGRDQVEFKIGIEVEKWVHAILNPPSRMQKLGVKPEMRVWMGGQFEEDFISELYELGALAASEMSECDIAFLKLSNRDELNRVARAAKQLPSKTNLWIIWPKGGDSIRQSDIMKLTAAIGLAPSKTAAFNDDLSSMRFAKRQ